MADRKKSSKNHKRTGLPLLYKAKVQGQVSSAPWILRITEHKDKPVPLMIVKERIQAADRKDADRLKVRRSILKERGLLYGPPQLRCLPVIRSIVSRVQDEAGVPLELNRFFQGTRISFRGNLPLDSEAGFKVALLFKLQERIKELDRVELMARRIERFSREEAAYWYSRMTSFSSVANRWAAAGMKIMLSGHGGDRDRVLQMLRELKGG